MRFKSALKPRFTTYGHQNCCRDHCRCRTFMIRSALDSPDVGASFETHYHVWEASEIFFQTNNARRFNFFSPIGEKGLTFKIETKMFKPRFTTHGHPNCCRDNCRCRTFMIRNALDFHDLEDCSKYP